MEKMKKDHELYNLCDVLGRIAENKTLSAEERTALKKAALALHIVFEKNHAEDLYNRYNNLETPLTDEENDFVSKL